MRRGRERWGRAYLGGVDRGSRVPWAGVSGIRGAPSPRTYWVPRWCQRSLPTSGTTLAEGQRVVGYRGRHRDRVTKVDIQLIGRMVCKSLHFVTKGVWEETRVEIVLQVVWGMICFFLT